MIKNIIRILALILVVAALYFGRQYMYKLEGEDSARIAQLYSQAEPLEREREELTQQRDNLPKQYALEFRDYATTELFFPKMENLIYNQAYPLMRERNIVGVLGISPSTYPDNWNTLTKDQVKALLADGWGMCMVYEYAWGDWNYFFNTVEALCTAYEIPMPDSIYYPGNDYKPEDDAILKEHGVKTVIVKASDGRSGTVMDVTADLWFTGAMAYGYTGYDIDLELLGRTDGGNLTYTVTLTGEWVDKNGKSKETKEEKAFTDFLDKLKEYLYFESPLDSMEQVASASSVFVNQSDKEELYELYLQELSPDQKALLPRVRETTYEQARDFHLNGNENSQEKKAEMDAKIAELDAKIAELDTQLEAIYAQFHESSKR